MEFRTGVRAAGGADDGEAGRRVASVPAPGPDAPRAGIDSPRTGPEHAGAHATRREPAPPPGGRSMIRAAPRGRPGAARAPTSGGMLVRRPAGVLLALALFIAFAYGSTLRVPFIGDDYVFLDKTRGAAFPELWSRANTDFGWYRPWSREVHFWLLQGVFGPREAGFRLMNLALWVVVLGLYWRLLRRPAGDRAATLATLGVASLSLWGAPLTWISGAQDLWMLVFALLTLLLDGRRRVPWALATFALALLSKETAAVLPIILFARNRFLEGMGWPESAKRAIPFAVVTLAWIWVHPVLLDRLTHPAAEPTTGDRPIPPWEIGLRSLLSLVNLDRVGSRVDPQALRPLATLGSSLLLAGAALLAARAKRGEPAAASPARHGLAAFGGVWCAAGWMPLLSPSVGWHAYYGSLGALGGWLVFAVLLDRIPRAAAGLLLVLGVLRGVAAATPSWDWGSEWYQTRAGNMLNLIRAQLLELHPTLPPHARLYFGSIPNNIGLVAGRSPAVRVWYGDPTLTAGFYSWYRPRGHGQPAGADLFFHFDSTSGIREVRPEAPPPPGLEPGSAWELDHESLAVTLVTAGDLPRAARLFEHIGSLPHRPDALMFAGTCWSLAGDTARAARLLDSARIRTGGTVAEIEAWAARLRGTAPRALPVPR